MQEAIVEVTDTAGGTKAATFTTQYKSGTDKVEIKGLGFTFSSTKIAITLKKPVESPPLTQTAESGSTKPKVDSKKNSTRVYTIKSGATYVAAPGDLLVFKSSLKGRWLVGVDPAGLIKTLPLPKGLGVSSGVALTPQKTGSTTIPISVGAKKLTVKLVIR